MNNEKQERIRTLKCECFDIDVGLNQLNAQAKQLVDAKQARFAELEKLLKEEHDAKVVADAVANDTNKRSE